MSKNVLPEDLPSLLKVLRGKRGMSQQDVVDASGGRVKSSHIGKAEVGKLGMRPEKAAAFADAVQASDEERAHLMKVAGATKAPDPIKALEQRVSDVEGSLAALSEEFAALIADLRAGQS